MKAVKNSLLILIGLLAAAAPTPGVKLTVTLPSAAYAKSASVIGGNSASDGHVKDNSVAFENLQPAVAYDLKIELADGTILQGADMGWYNEEPAAQDVEPINEQDREQIQAILDVTRFYNIMRILQLRGDHDRATVLVELIRDMDFHNGAGEIVWRVELWYFKNQYGGWEAIPQQNRVLRRERFKSREAYAAVTEKLRWMPALGGVRLESDQPEQQIILKDIGDAQATEH